MIGLRPVRRSPLWEMSGAGRDEFDLQAQAAPDGDFDQRIAWQVPRQDQPTLLVRGDSCMVPPNRPSPASLPVPGSDRAAILNTSRQIPEQNPGLTTPVDAEILSKVG